MRKAFGREDLEQVFKTVGEKISQPVRVFLLGGGAMAFRNQKAATKDLDLLFENAGDCKLFSSALSNLGFSEKPGLEKAYSEMAASGGIWENGSGFRFDLFVGMVCNAIRLSRGVKKRSTKLGSYGNLEVMLVSNEDVILLKSITEREDDTNDIAAIIISSQVDWSIFLGECRAQSGERPWFGPVLDKLNELREKRGIDAPITREIEKLYQLSAIRDAYKIRLAKGMAREVAITELKKLGFTEKEIKEAKI